MKLRPTIIFDKNHEMVRGATCEDGEGKDETQFFRVLDLIPLDRLTKQHLDKLKWVCPRNNVSRLDHRKLGRPKTISSDTNCADITTRLGQI